MKNLAGLEAEIVHQPSERAKPGRAPEGFARGVLVVTPA